MYLAKRSHYPILAVLISVSAALAANAQTTAIWTGDGPEDGWSDARNWTGDKVPNNVEGVFYGVIIDGDNEKQTSVFAPGKVEINSLIIDQGDSLLWGSSQNQITINSTGLNSGRLENNGTVLLDGSAVGGSLVFDGGGLGMAVLEGSGIIILNGGDIRPGLLGDRLEHVANHTIQGFGGVQIPIDNKGQIVADINGETLIVGAGSLQGVTSVNNGALIARNGGILSIAGEWINEGKELRPEAGSQIKMALGSKVVGGSIISSENAQVDINNGVFVAGPDLNTRMQILSEGPLFDTNGFQLQGYFQVKGSFAIRPSGPVNGGSLILNSSESSSLVTLNPIASRADIILLDEGLTGISDPTGTADLLIGTNMTIGGTGVFGNGSIDIQNFGSIVACIVDRRLFVQPRERLINVGRLASASTNSPGLPETNSAGNLVLLQGIYENSSGSDLGSIEASDSYGFVEFWNGTYIIGGSIDAVGSGARFFVNKGKTTLDGIEKGPVFLRGNDLSTESADLYVERNATLALIGRIFNEAQIIVEGSGFSSAEQGIIEIAGDVDISGDRFDIEFNPDATFILPGGITNAGRTNPSIELTHPVGSVIQGLLGVEELINGDSHTIRGTGKIGADQLALRNLGLILADKETPLIIDVADDLFFRNFGKIHATGAGGVIIEPGNLRQQGEVSITFPSSLTRNGGDYVINGPDSNNEFDTFSGVTIMTTGAIFIGGVNAINGPFDQIADGNVIVEKTGLLRGDGTIQGIPIAPGVPTIPRVDLINSGTVQPIGRVLEEGFSAGLIMNGDFKQMPTGDLIVTTNDSVNSQITCRNAELSGTLQFICTGGRHDLGDKITIVECSGTRTGTFDEESIVFLNLHPGLQPQLNYNSNSVEIEMVDNGTGNTGEAYGEWRDRQDFENEIDSAPNADPDKDNKNNQQERAFGTNPLVANKGPLVEVTTIEEDGVSRPVFKFKRPAGPFAPNDLSYNVLQSTDLIKFDTAFTFTISPSDLEANFETILFNRASYLTGSHFFKFEAVGNAISP